jgi:hypothetical protein
MAVSQLRDFDLRPGSKAGLRLSIAGTKSYARVLQSAFGAPAVWYGPYDSFDKRYDYVLYVQQLTEAEIRPFLSFLTSTLMVDSVLEEAWALGMHMSDEGDRTDLGELVYRAKTYSGKPGETAAARELGDLMAARAALHPRIQLVDLVLPVPVYPPRRPHNLPDVLAERVAGAIGATYSPDGLVKTRSTDIKNLPNDEKLAALTDAFQVTKRIEGARVLLIDDLLFSGSTLGYLAGLLREAGVASVFGFVATKTLRS